MLIHRMKIFHSVYIFATFLYYQRFSTEILNLFYKNIQKITLVLFYIIQQQYPNIQD